MRDPNPTTRRLWDLDRAYGGPSASETERVRCAVAAKVAAGAMTGMVAANVVTKGVHHAAAHGGSSASSAVVAGKTAGASAFGKLVTLAGGAKWVAAVWLTGALTGSAVTRVVHRAERVPVATTHTTPPAPETRTLEAAATRRDVPDNVVGTIAPDLSATALAPERGEAEGNEGVREFPTTHHVAKPPPPPVTQPDAKARTTLPPGLAPSPPVPSSVPTEAAGASPVPPTVDETLPREVALLQRAQGALRGGQPLEALLLLDQHAQLFPQGRLTEERDAARVVALCGLGRTSEATLRAQSFLLARPLSPLAPRVRQACAAH